MSSDNYCGSGHSFSELVEMGRRERNTVLAEALYKLDEQLKPMQDNRKQLAAWLQQDMFEQGASIIDAGDYEVTREESSVWEYDVEGLSGLQRYLTPEQYERAVQPTVKVNKSELNKLKKLGREVVSIIDQSCLRRVTGIKISAKRKKTGVSPEPRVFSSDAAADDQ